jgi:sugar transferase (PEP-CTERM/EpsH1 system associated)
VRIVYVTSRFPFPVEKGDKLRAYHQIRILSQRHEIHLVAISHKKVPQKALEAMNPFCKSVKVFRIKEWLLPFQLLTGWMEGLPLQVSYFLDRTIKRKVQYHIINLNPDHVICQLIRAAGYVRALPFPKTLDYMDVFSEGMRQLANRHQSMKSIFNLEAERLAAFERTIYKDFDHHIIISAQDRERLKLPTKDHIAIIPNGVDTTFWTQNDFQRPSYDLVFVGNLGYGPNKASALYLVNQIIPELKKRNRQVSVLIAGARPGSEIEGLNHFTNVTVKGWMDDIREAYRDGRIFVAPMFSGLGLQNKILEAMSMGLPCVTTSMVNNAIGATSGVHILVADTLQDMTDSIEFLLDHPVQSEQIAHAGREFVQNHFNWNEQVTKMEDFIFSKMNISTNDRT